MQPIDYSRARRVLARRDPIIRDLMRRHGACRLAEAQKSDPFRALCHAIIAQQLSTKAAATIEGRFAALFGGTPTPSAVAHASDEQLRAVGLSPQKLRYMRDLSTRVQDGSLTLHGLEALSDDDVIAALTSVKGIGRWMAEMFLIFRLHRSDVLPFDDLGIVNVVKCAYRLRVKSTAARLTRIGEAWRSYRSVACWYFWASLDPPPPMAKAEQRI